MKMKNDMTIADSNAHDDNESLVVDDAILEFRQKITIINQTEEILSNTEVRKRSQATTPQSHTTRT